MFNFFVYPKGEDTLCVDSVYASGRNDINGELYIREGSQEYYLKINVANLERYLITIQQKAPAIKNPPFRPSPEATPTPTTTLIPTISPTKTTTAR